MHSAPDNHDVCDYTECIRERSLRSLSKCALGKVLGVSIVAIECLPSCSVHRRQMGRRQNKQIHRAFQLALKRAHMPNPLPVLLMPRAAACCIENSSERKSGKGGTALDWSQSDIAVRLQLAGWDIDRIQLSKIECRLVHFGDFQQLYFLSVFKISFNELPPSQGCA